MYAPIADAKSDTYITPMFDRHRRAFKSTVDTLLDMVLPAHCIISGEAVDAPNMLSAYVWEQLEFISDPCCSVCGAPFSFESNLSGTLCVSCIHKRPDYDLARSALLYSDMSRKLILKFKSADQMQVAHTFTPWLMSAAAEFIGLADYIIPVPLHKSRLLKRRYNQAAILAQNLSACTNTPILFDGLVRVRATAIQGSAKAKSRKSNVSGAFDVVKMHKDKLTGKKIILIDDVYASGSTVNECTKALKKAGAANVYVLTIARAITPL